MLAGTFEGVDPLAETPDCYPGGDPRYMRGDHPPAAFALHPDDGLPIFTAQVVALIGSLKFGAKCHDDGVTEHSC